MAGSVGLAVPALAQPVQEAPDGMPLRALMKTPEWQAVKAAWAALDSLAPEDGGCYGYPRGMSLDDRDTLRDMVADRLDDLDYAADAAGARPPELSAFRALLLRRVDFLCNGETRLMTRMIPPAVTMDASTALRQMEIRIDTLLALRESGRIGIEAWKAGAEAAVDAGAASVILEALACPGYRAWGGSPEYLSWDPQPDDIWALVKMRMSQARRMLADSLMAKDAVASLSEALASADSLLNMLPGLEMMLSDLVGGG